MTKISKSAQAAANSVAVPNLADIAASSKITVGVFASKDLASGAFMTPFFVAHAGLANRGFVDAVNSSNDTDISRHPEDFELYELGFFEQNTGRLIAHDTPRLMIRGVDAKRN